MRLAVVPMVVFEETFIRTLLDPATVWSQVNVLLPLIATTLLQTLALSALGIKFVLTFRTPRGFDPFLESMGEAVGLIVIIPMLGPPSPKNPFALESALFAFMLVIKTLIPLLALP